MRGTFQQELRQGIAVEMEHTDDPRVAMRIAMDHLDEDPRYYTKLKGCFPGHHNPCPWRRRKRNPDSENHYHTFHGVEPSKMIEGRMWVPGELVLMGMALDVGYGISEPCSSKDGWYVHDFGRGVKAYRRAEEGEQADKTYRRFPTELMVLGYALGFTYEDGDSIYEVKGSNRKKLAVTPNKKTLVIVGSSGVEFLMTGGNMRVTDWIRD
jgi:hypothetical protein